MTDGTEVRYGIPPETLAEMRAQNLRLWPHSDFDGVRQPAMPELDLQEFMTVLDVLESGIRAAVQIPAGQPYAVQFQVLSPTEPEPDSMNRALAELRSIAIRMLKDGSSPEEVEHYLRRVFHFPNWAPMPPSLVDKARAGFVALKFGPDGAFRPKAAVIPFWAVVACSASAIQTMLSPLDPVGWTTLGVVVSSTLAAAKQQLTPVQAQLVAELYISTDSARVSKLPKNHLLANVNSSRERARQTKLESSEFEKEMLDLEDRKLLLVLNNQGESVIHWGMITIG